MNDLRKTRRMTGLTQTRLARAAVMSRSRLSQAECGEVTLTKQEETRLRRALRRAIEARAAKFRTLLDEDSSGPWTIAGRTGKSSRLRCDSPSA
jgi:transcriptional regulator with XRE-family HTH domain